MGLLKIIGVQQQLPVISFGTALLGNKISKVRDRLNTHTSNLRYSVKH